MALSSTLKKGLFATALIATASVATYLLKTTDTPTVYRVGTGSGTITIDGSKTSYKANDTIKVRGGKYSNFTIKNINIKDGYVHIINEDLVEIVGDLKGAYIPCSFSAIRGVRIAGNGTPGIDKGFYFHDNRYRMIEIWGINGVLKDFTMQNCRFKTIQDYNITFAGLNTVYNGADSTVSSNLKFINIEAEDCSLVNGAGDPGTGKGLLRGLEIAGCYFHDSPGAGTLVYWAGVDDYNVHDNIVDNINQNNNNHNGIFMLVGNGKFEKNKVSRHQGNLIRAWCFSISATPKTIDINNNIAYDSRKYSAFELQVPPYLSDILKKNKGKYSTANAKLSNNTAGKMNTSRDWEGLMLDLYNLEGGVLEYSNNLGFDLYRSNNQPIGDMINNMSDVKITKSNNQYCKTWQEAVSNLTDFKSLFPGIGANTTPVNVYYNYKALADFTRDNCKPNQTGSVVTYIVAAGKYSSTISQEDADAKATEDIKANGQNYANTNGTCTDKPPVKKITAIIYVYSDGSTETKLQ